ncbi:hypothetical protein LTR37_014128 [Vermiconidia calcicola]|uniref:Uncharacterized protein n=1 Tax=Vermiconidia calcicola TaxID=1690605 RepID=A0ACC3MVV7_9PEZI|nr:hypothetical protein LTR37_014128 [Vermiconidia calcicola]
MTEMPARSGESTIAIAIADKVSSEHVKCQVVSVEGFLKPKSELSEEQMKRRGAIETFDGDAVVNMFRTLRERGPGHELDPVPDVQRIEPDSEVVIFERIYLLPDQKPWNEIEELIDEKWFIHVRPHLCRERVAGRRVDKGISETKEEALKSYDESDGMNDEFISKHRYHTDVII